MLMNGTQQLRFNVRLKFRSRTIHFDSLIARGKSHEGVPKSDTKAFNPESNFHLKKTVAIRFSKKSDTNFL